MSTLCKRLVGIALILAIAISFAVPVGRASANETKRWVLCSISPTASQQASTA